MWQQPTGIGPGLSGARLLTTLTLVNTSGSTQAANFVAPMFGHVFKKGDIPSSAYPQFQLTDGTPCPATIFAQNAWSDGSMKRCSVLMRVPTTITNSGSLTINVLSGGSTPASSSLSLSNVSARTLQTVLSGLTNLSGTWTSDINTGISNNTEVKVIANGPSGMVWRIRRPFAQSGTPHTFLTCYWYVAALQDASSGLWRIRFLPQIVSPYYNDSLGTKVKYGFTAQLKDGANTVATLSPVTAVSATTSSGVASISAPSHGLTRGQVVRFSGSVPTGLSAGTDYYVQPLDTDHVELNSIAGDAAQGFAGGTLVVPASTVSSGLTMTPHIELAYFASVYGAQANGTWQSVQGGGSGATDCTVRVQFDKAYMRATRLIPPYDTGQTTSTYAAFNYSCNGGGGLTPLRSFEGETGIDGTIGPQPSWVPAHFLNQDANSEQTVRVGALSRGHANLNLRDVTTGSLPVVNNTTYTGMPASNKDFLWFQDPRGGATVGFTIPSDDIVGCFATSSTAHAPSAAYYAALITGEPQFIDMMAMVANWSVYCRPYKTIVVGPTTYYGCCFQDPYVIRADAWGSRELALCVALMPTLYWEMGDVRTCLTDYMTDGYDGMNAYNAAQNSFWTTNGLYIFEQSALMAPWQLNYLIEATAMAYAVTENSAALTFLNHLLKWPGAIAADVGIYWYTCYYYSVRQTNSVTGPIISSMSQVFYLLGGDGQGTWDSNAGTNLVTYSVVNSYPRFNISVGDKVKWVETSSDPSGVTDYAEYFCRQVTDPGLTQNKTFKVATTNSDATIVTLGTASGFQLTYRPGVVTLPSGGAGLNSTSGSEEARAAFRMSEAVGATVPAGIRVAMDVIFANGASDFSTNAKYAMNTSY